MGYLGHHCCLGCHCRMVRCPRCGSGIYPSHYWHNCHPWQWNKVPTLPDAGIREAISKLGG